MLLHDKLKKVPVYSKQELLLYIHDQEASTTIQIVTNSGQVHKGIVLNINDVKDEGYVLMLQCIDYNQKITNSALHIAIRKIESIEFLEDQNILGVLSKGTVFESKVYEVSGKLQVKKALQKFSDIIFETSNVRVGVPNIIFPTDGKQLNRVLQLTELLQNIILNILKEEDAHISWKSNYDSMAFVESDKLKIIKSDNTMEIHFPFTDLELPEIPIEETTSQILAVL
ncbi:hypothetical protein [Flavivirga algicola]|uniref:Uncharacterized protein n=1 Tax=Flavivirga algicola TaxID=2729136 RepID=A0ABX1RSB9_9FLAO|nr:hypothetical protein [Flavivirga algicola]NMH86442.1 hypothetical protein [Flavivirga algicola]